MEAPAAKPAAPGAIACWSCRRAVDPADPYCRWCGKRLQVDDHWYFRPFWIVAMTLTVAGPFTLPLVWKSPSLKRGERIWLTLFIVGVSILVLWLCWVVYEILMAHFSDLAQTAREMQ